MSETELLRGSKPYRSFWTDMLRTPFEHGWIDVNGISTRYVRAGRRDQPALIMLHGTSGHLETFSGNFESHAAHFQCFAFDMVGSGFSDKPDRDLEIVDYVSHTIGFMERVGVKSASFIGVSLGAWIASKLALDFPRRAEKLVLLSTAGLKQSVETQANIMTGRSKVVEDPSHRNVVEVMSKLIYDKCNITEDIVAVRQMTYRLPYAKRSMQHVLVLQKSSVRESNNLKPDDWRNIVQPTLIVAAIDDPNVWLDTAYELSELIPNSRLIEMAEVAHWPHFEKPLEFNLESLKFLLDR